jgi:hypothetical protein
MARPSQNILGALVTGVLRVRQKRPLSVVNLTIKKKNQTGSKKKKARKRKSLLQGR